jgi:hypothetical protein
MNLVLLASIHFKAFELSKPNEINIVTCMCVTTRSGLDWWIDLLPTYAHNSELQAITAPPLISTLYSSLLHKH